MSSENKIQELQAIEQNLQNLLMQKQAFQMELAETDSATLQIKNSGEEVYKIVGQLMIKSEKSKILEELENKKKMLEIRIKVFEKQEQAFSEKSKGLREEVMKSSRKK